MPTFTAPGHATISTGMTPEVHGIIANSWFNIETGKRQYCVSDTSVRGIGTESEAGRMSIKNLKMPTVTDHLKKQNSDARVVSISLKDRGAILPGGKNANGVYWFVGKEEGKWITSSYYIEQLPSWVHQVNNDNFAEDYLNSTWNTLLPIEDYVESIEDDNVYEGPFKGASSPVFPHKLSTPGGNTLVKNMAVAAINGEELGKDEVTDFLSISFSSTDYIGHQFGPYSVEIEDAYLRLDKDLASLFTEVEKQLSNQEVLIYLTSDHGVVNNPQYLIDHNQPGGYFNLDELKEELNAFVLKHFKQDNLILYVSKNQVYLNEPLMKEQKLNASKIKDKLVEFLLDKTGVALAISDEKLMNMEGNRIVSSVQRGFYSGRSGHIIFVLESGWIVGLPGSTGTTHGSPYSYDTHVPLIWYGANIKQGSSSEKVAPCDIVPTLSYLLGIGSDITFTGQILREIIMHKN